MNIQKLAIVTIIALILVGSVYFGHSTEAKSKDKKARDAIVKAMGRAVEGHYTKIDLASLSIFNDNSTITFYNKSGTITPQPNPPPPNPTPTPVPTPSPSGYKLCFAGDLSGSAVPDAMKKQCNYRIGLGDLGYKSDLSWFKSLAFNKCVIGNHDSNEDGSSSIYKEALAYCGDSWWMTLGNQTLILGFNTNSNTDTQLKAAASVISSHSSVKNIIALSHKNGHVFPNAHHPSEASSLYSQLEQLVPSNVKLYEVGGHNHNSASADAKHWFIAGSGGKSFYSCGQDQDWTFCDNKAKAFLQFTIDNNGTITPNFYDTGDKILH